MKLELLAPAGGWESLIAAINNGADAVYIGGKSFSARAYAVNFDDDEVYKAINYCHLYGRKIYLTINTLYDDTELKDVLKYAEDMYIRGIDAFIVQDLGAALCMIKMGLPVHASTQMTIHNLNEVKLLKDLGIKRIVLARELCIDEIEYITKNVSIETEVFIHGALCFCYSGQCLMSSFIGGRSGNRGRCAQPCRKIYTLVDESTKEVKKVNVFSKGYLMSMKDLNTLKYIDKLRDTGVTSLKIEGRMKRPEYVALVVNAYRKAIDKNLKDEDVLKAEAVFNREFTKGYIFGDRDRDVINVLNPKNKGIYVGELTDIKNGIGHFKFNIPVSLGDGLCIGDDGFIVVSMKQNGINVSNAVGKVSIPLKEKDLKPGKVYRTLNPSLIKEAQKTFDNEYADKISLQAKVYFKIGHPFKLSVKYKDKEIKVESEALVEKAIKKPMLRERLIEQIKKTGNTPFYFGKIDLDYDDDATIAVSVVNDIRRKALVKIEEQIYKRNIVINEIDLNLEKIERETNSIKLYAQINDYNEIDGLIKAGIDGIYFGSFNEIDIVKAYQKTNSHNIEFVYVLPSILHDKFCKNLYDKINTLRQNGIERFLLGNIGEIDLLLSSDTKYMDFANNVFNSFTALGLKQMGAESVCLSPELKISEIKMITHKVDLQFELYGYGYVPVMISEYDITCGTDAYGVKDSKGAVFPVRRDELTHIYNSKPIYLADKLDDFMNIGIDRIRLDFTVKCGNVDSKDIIKSYKMALNGNMSDANNMRENIGDYTRGHYYKGVE